jgi:hypothetical protein
MNSTFMNSTFIRIAMTINITFTIAVNIAITISILITSAINILFFAKT